MHRRHVGTAATEGHTACSEYLAGGARARAERARRWYAEDADLLRRALL